MQHLPQLDNVVWHALDGPQAHFAEGTSQARRFPDDVGPFAAIPDEARPEAWEALRELVGAGRTAVLFRPALDVPEGWEIRLRMACRQMVCVAAGAARHVAVSLGADDVPEMLDLAEHTRPGPFAARTHELGRYLGFRREGRLVAMAGERLRIAGGTEISAVCTDPAHRGRGLAAALVSELTEAIVARGEIAFLHVLLENTPAIRIYEALGFETRREVEVIAARAPR